MKTLDKMITEKLQLKKGVTHVDVPVDELSDKAWQALDDLQYAFNKAYDVYCDEVGDDEWDADDFYITLFEHFFEQILEDNDFYIKSALAYWFESHKNELK